ncbi:MFS transporter [Roseateles sp. SL47]|uniref:MFS transporter n=1 Tax=Roseateles sp. SL47 TaxID=2995138 RepID=UPI002270B6C9|nr:MFS transporter [Roseateles sp. SL47]WAC73335.1 MFS transporter [Roseateles sp. SL47]
MTLAIAAVMFMLVLDGSILNTSLPAIAASQGVPPLALSAVVTAYLLAASAVLPLSSWLGERHGLRKMFLIGVGVFTLASLLCGLAQTPAQLVLARVVQGIGGGLLLPLGRTMALRGAGKQDIVGIQALLVWPALFGPVLGPPLGGLLSTYASWRWNFLLNVPIGLIGMLLLSRWVPRDTPGTPRPFDLIGFIGAAGGLTLFIGGVEWVSHDVGAAQGRLAPWACGLAGLAVLVWTVRHLSRAKHPVVSLSPFEQHSFAIATTGGTLASTAIQSTPFLLPLLFQLGMGKDAVSAGAMLLPYFAANLGMKTVTTPILHRFGFRRVMIGAGLISALSIAAFALVDAQTPWALLIGLLIVSGASRSMSMTAINTLAVSELPQHQLGASSTLAAISSQVAGAMGVAVGALVLAVMAHLGGREQLAVSDFSAAFLVVAALNALALLQFRRLARNAGADILRPKGART